MKKDINEYITKTGKKISKKELDKLKKGQLLIKAKRLPIGTISKGRKKIKEGLWMPIKKRKKVMVKKEEKEKILIKIDVPMNKEIRTTMENTLKNYINKDGLKNINNKVSGKINSNKSETIADNMRSVLDAYSHTLPGDVTSRANKMVTIMERRMKLCKNLDVTLLNKLSQDAMHKMVFQEIESRRRQLGDHGIRHLTGNIIFKDQILDVIPGKRSPEDKLMLDFVMLEHDIGYTSKASKENFGKTHREDSAEFISGETDYSKLFGEDKAKWMKEIIKTHDSGNMEWEKQPLESAIRLSDNLALFYPEKLPALFRYIPRSINKLEEIQKANIAEDKDKIKKIKSELNKNIDDSNLDKLLKRDLKMAVDEVFIKTGKFSLGLFAGTIDKISYDKKKGVAVDIKSNEYEKRLQILFDMGQSQFKKLADAYNINDKDLKSKNEIQFKKGNKSLLNIKISVILKKSIKLIFRR